MEYLKRKVFCGTNRIISSLGVTTEENYRGIENYVTNITKFSDGTPVCKIDRQKIDLSQLDEYTFAEQLSIIALSDVIKRGSVDICDGRTLVIISTTKGNIECANSDIDRCYLWRMSEKIASYFHCANRPLIISDACISGVAAVVVGGRYIEQGDYDNVLVLGIDVISDFVVSGFNSFRSISPTICRPYDIERDGLTLGEACAVLLLSADDRHDEISVVVSGGALSNDANHISGPSRTGDGLHFAIDAALRKASLSPSEVSFVNLHGTGTLFNDEMESKAMELSLLRDIPTNSLKPYFGHTLGASGVMEVILSIEQLRHNHIFGVKGYHNSGLNFELNVSGNHRDKALFHCLKTASGFGGTNAAVVLSKHNCLKISQVSEVEIIQGEIPFSVYIREEYKSLGENYMKFFKMDDLCKLGYIASCKLLKGIKIDIPSNRIGIVLSCRSSSMESDLTHQNLVNQNLPQGASPSVFVYTLANIVAAEIAIRHKFQGELMMFVNEEKNIEFLKEYSSKLIQQGVCDGVLYGWCDYFNNKYNCEMKFLKKI